MDLQKWIEEWVTLETDDQKADFDQRFRAEVAAIPEAERAAFQDMFYNSAVSALNEAKDIIVVANIRKSLEPIINYVSLSEIAEKYFKKSRQWLYQRLNGNIVNGVPAKFTNDEISTLKKALNEISENMRQVAQSI